MTRESDGGTRSLAALRRALREDARTGAFSTLVNGVAGSPLMSRHLRVAIYKAVGMRIAGAEVWPRVTFKTNRIVIGSRVFVNERCTFDNEALVTIEDRVSVAMEVLFATTTHELGDGRKRAGRVRAEPIVVRRGSWIGARATLLPGVTVGEGCVIASGAVVTSDCAPHGLYGGVPARRLRDLPLGRAGAADVDGAAGADGAGAERAGADRAGPAAQETTARSDADDPVLRQS